VIQIPNLLAGIDTMSTYLMLVFAIWVFKRFLIQRDWRFTTYASCLLTAR
jgi:hypothetical protein